MHIYYTYGPTVYKCYTADEQLANQVIALREEQSDLKVAVQCNFRELANSIRTLLDRSTAIEDKLDLLLQVILHIIIYHNSEILIKLLAFYSLHLVLQQAKCTTNLHIACGVGKIWLIIEFVTMVNNSLRCVYFSVAQTRLFCQRHQLALAMMPVCK